MKQCLSVFIPPDRTRSRLIVLMTLVLLLAPTPVSAQSEVTCATDVIVQRGDTLSTLAEEHLDSLRAYTTIINATNARAAIDASYATITNANVLEIGWKLCIPAVGATQSALANRINQSTAQTFDLMTIDALRQQNYPGSAIRIEETLTPGANYNRYIASYQSDGLKIYALLTVPNGAAPATGWPVIVFNHGFTLPQFHQTASVGYEDTFARNGFIVFRSDYRGHGNSEGDALGGFAAADFTSDVLNAVASIKQYPAADPNRIGMWGHSLGGYITLQTMVVTQDVKAGVIWAGVVGSYTDLLAQVDGLDALIPAQARQWRDDLIAAHGTPSQNPTYWNSISANSYVADLSGPLQLHHGTNDFSIPIEFSDTLFQQVQAADKLAEYYRYPGDDHNISNHFALAMQRSVAFFDQYLK